jgi:magnesium chelatase subunit D
VRREDVLNAAELVFAHRARTLPDQGPAEPSPAPPAPEPGTDSSENDSLELTEDLILEAVKAALPPDVLDRLAAARAARVLKGGAGTGEARTGHRRGRPLPARPGRPDGNHRLDLIATLRAAAPWQAVRRRQMLSATQLPLPTAEDAASERLRLLVRPSDLRIRRHQERTERVLIFAVDASGSAALARLAEAKGAIELLLARAYSRRDHVALISFRGNGAELILPPTRSLVQTKRRLSGLPGGGGTPLAAALRLAGETALRARTRGLTPILVLLTDGRANVGLDGAPGRERALAEAMQMARSWRATGAASVVIDTASRPEAGLRQLAVTLGGAYLALPRADAARMSNALETALAPGQSG